MIQRAEMVSTSTTYVASATAVVFGLTVSEWQAVGVIGGLILGTLTFGVNWYFKCKQNKERK